MPEAPRLARRLQEGTGDVEELGNFQQEGIMTAIGLAVAVPAVLGYNWLVRRNKVTMEAVRGFSADLHGVLMGARGAR